MSCEQIYLQQFVSSNTVSRIEQQLIWTIKATNITDKTILGPISIISSYFGKVILTDIGITPGQTLTITVNTLTSTTDLTNNTISSAVYAAKVIQHAQNLKVGERISAVVVTDVIVNKPQVNVSGLLSINERTDEGFFLGLNLNITNKGTLDIYTFKSDLSPIFGSCSSIMISILGSPFQVDGTILSLSPGFIISPGQNIIVPVAVNICNNGCATSGSESCLLNYTFSGFQTPIFQDSVGIGITSTGRK